MHKYGTIVALIFAILLGSGTAVLAADYDKGLRAYRAGDFDAALAEWVPLAEQGNAVAQFSLGLHYELGSGVVENDKIAVKWYTKAAEQGDAWAQTNLGVKYRYGEGVFTDYVRAYMWYNLGAYNGNELGAENRTIISKRMTPAQIAKAQEMYSRCLESNYKGC